MISTTPERATHWTRRLFPDYNVDPEKTQDIVCFAAHHTEDAE